MYPCVCFHNLEDDDLDDDGVLLMMATFASWTYYFHTSWSFGRSLAFIRLRFHIDGRNRSSLTGRTHTCSGNKNIQYTEKSERGKPSDDDDTKEMSSGGEEEAGRHTGIVCCIFFGTNATRNGNYGQYSSQCAIGTLRLRVEKNLLGLDRLCFS